MAQIVGSYLVDLMIRSGVRNIYGIVGDSANPVIDAIRKSDGNLKFINVRKKRPVPSPREPTLKFPGDRLRSLGHLDLVHCICSTASMTAREIAPLFLRSPRMSRLQRLGRTTSRKRARSKSSSIAPSTWAM